MADANERDEQLTRHGDVLGLGGAEVPQTEADRELGAESNATAESRRRRADDLAEHELAPSDPIGGPKPPHGLHVED
jgi:hypothetical protein